MNIGKSLTTRSNECPVVCVIDDDVSVREGLESLIRAAGWHARTFSLAREFLACPRFQEPCCLILDLSLPDLSGLQLQHQIADRPELPVIFLTGDGDVPTSVTAMKAGAREFMTKPFRQQELLDAIDSAIQHSRAVLERDAAHRVLEERYAVLTSRERQVMALVVQGKANKCIGADLGISEITVKAHRGKVMRKMMARSIAELVVFSGRLAARGNT